jgi:hypothetical protein
MMDTNAKPEPPKHPAELLALWRREGDWVTVPDNFWRQARDDMKQFCKMGWGRTAWHLGWTPDDLFGLRRSVRDGKLITDHWGLVARLQGGSMIVIDSKSALYRHHKKTFLFRKSAVKAKTAA